MIIEREISPLEYCQYKYYNECNVKELINEVKKIDQNATIICNAFIFIFNKVLHTDPCSYWNKDVYKETLVLLEDLYTNHSSQLNIDESIFNYFLMGYNSYSQITEIITDLKTFNISSELKTRLYRLPTYSSLVESCLSNFLRVIVNLIGQGIGKDYSVQNKLGSLIDIIKKHGYDQIVSNTNVNVRNAINHGKVIVRSEAMHQQLCFYYEENHVSKTLEMPMYEFDKIIDNTYDTVSGVLLALSSFISNHIDLLNINRSKKEYTSFSLHALELSIPKIQCINISDTGNSKQLNIEMKVENTDRGYLGILATCISVIIYEYYNDYEQYMISFSNPRMITGWMRFQNQEIQDMSSKTKTLDQVVREVVARKDCIIFDASTEDIDLNEVKYFCFPNYKGNGFKINKVEDASLPDKKRLKAHLFINDEEDKLKILDIINQSIEWLKTVKNPPTPSYVHKHGDMPAESIYINVYRKDGRKSKEMFTNNENFVCFVDYNENGITTLDHGGVPPVVWNSYHHEKIGNVQIAWREKKYFARRVQRIWNNDPCPCGSGLKYKKCCGRKSKTTL